jgi:hypothetical protein
LYLCGENREVGLRLIRSASDQRSSDTVLPVTNLATEITPDRLEEKGDTLFYFYDAKVGEAQSYSTQPVSLIILDKKLADKTALMRN